MPGYSHSVGELAAGEAVPIEWQDDVGTIRYKYRGGGFVPSDRLDSIWREISEAIVDDSGAE